MNTLGKFLIGVGSVLISAGEHLSGRRWLHPAERSNAELDLELNGDEPHVVGRIDLSR